MPSGCSLCRSYPRRREYRYRKPTRCRCLKNQSAKRPDQGQRRSDECRMYQDLREFIALVEKLGALRRIADADPQFEVGGITEVAAGLPECPALLFERIKGLAPGFRIFTNAVTSPQRAALALGIDPSVRPLDALKAWMEKRRTLASRPPVAV